MVQSAQLTIDGLRLYVQHGDALEPTTLAVPVNLSGDLNGPNGTSNLTFPVDPGAQVILIIQYHLGS